MNSTVAIAVLTILAAIPAVGFIALYVRMPWHRSYVGRGVMIQSVGITMLIGMGVLRVFFGVDYPWRPALLLIVYTALVVGQWAMFIALLWVLRSNPERLPRNDT